MLLFWDLWMMQDPLSMTLEQIVYFHDYLMMIMIMVMVSVSYSILFVSLGKGYSSSIIADHLVESIWTISPIIVLIFLAYPSIYLLYLTDENSVDFLCTLKVVGHQWHWSYPMDGLLNYEMDSYMDDSSIVRLTDVDNRAMVPSQEYIRALTTSNDVLHSWALPAIGLKMDAVPGRLNQFALMVTTNAVVHGQRSETCGVNHSFMPIVIESLSLFDILY